MKADWDFVYDEERFDHAGDNFAGFLQDKNNLSHVLFFHAYKVNEEDPIETCFIYTSVFMDNDSAEISYPWTADNDSLLIEALNNAGNDYCGDGCVLYGIDFKNKE